uniref:Uncharacterized protein n=1 Tax=Anguilla anguilla TaxID=7936 RepID=A0A0E9XJF7_ANGAN
MWLNVATRLNICKAGPCNTAELQIISTVTLEFDIRNSLNDHIFLKWKD